MQVEEELNYCNISNYKGLKCLKIEWPGKLSLTLLYSKMKKKIKIYPHEVLLSIDKTPSYNWPFYKLLAGQISSFWYRVRLRRLWLMSKDDLFLGFLPCIRWGINSMCPRSRVIIFRINSKTQSKIYIHVFVSLRSPYWYPYEGHQNQFNLDKHFSSMARFFMFN